MNGQFVFEKKGKAENTCKSKYKDQKVKVKKV